MEKGQLYVVATPIGNLSDISQRAIDILKSVAIVAAEDTRHSRKLMSSLGINASLVSLHDHNERSRAVELLRVLNRGEDVALVSDAGTPMISDPGFHLVRAVQDEGIRVIPVPGPSAVISALSVSGLPANRFCFYGFLPERRSARQTVLQELANVPVTLVFYESGRRMVPCLKDIADILGSNREAVICKELTKIYELVRRDQVGRLLNDMQSGELDQRGEFVLLVAGNQASDKDEELLLQTAKILLIELVDTLPLGKAASIISRALGCPRKQVYEIGLQLKDSDH